MEGNHLEARLIQLINGNGELREAAKLEAQAAKAKADEAARAAEAATLLVPTTAQEAGEQPEPINGKVNHSDFSADLITGEDGGFEIWLGSLDDALCLSSLRERGIGALLNCAVEECERECAAHRGFGGRRRAHARGVSAMDGGYCPANGAATMDRDQIRAVALFDSEWYTSMLGRDTSFLGIAADDVDGYNIERHFAEARAFLGKCRQEGRKVLVHCIMGINRSSAALVAFLCGELGMSLEEAIDLISKHRGHVLSNNSFLKQLITTYGHQSATKDWEQVLAERG